jgi:hypothetical protein
MVTVLGLALGGLLPGCGSEEAPKSQTEAPESKGGMAHPARSTPPARLPKNVNPDASNKGIKGKYAD